MTICIAAIAGNASIFGASDRMITSGDIEYEPAITEETRREGVPLKVFHLTNSIALMTAGDASAHSQIIPNVYRVVGARINQDQANWWNVADVAELYVQFYDELRLRRATSAILAPLGLNPDTFIHRQHEMSNSFITDLSDALRRYEMPDMQAIITGIDRSGTHIYVVHNLTLDRSITVSCEDTVGFAAIGIGSHHAESQFMLAGHHRSSAVADTLFLTYLAKKRSEVAPGVGTETDMLMIAQLGALQNLHPSIVGELHKIYETHNNAERSVLSEAIRQANEYVAQLGKPAAQSQQPKAGPTGPAGPATTSAGAQ